MRSHPLEDRIAQRKRDQADAARAARKADDLQAQHEAEEAERAARLRAELVVWESIEQFGAYWPGDG